MPDKKPKPLTAPGVSAALRTAGFERSESRTTRIRGHRSYSAGYRIQSGEPGEVSVSYMTGFATGADLDGRRDAELARYAATLRAKGWNVQTLPTGIPCLLVTELAEEAAGQQ